MARLGSVLHRSNPAGIGEHADIASGVEEYKSYKLDDDEASVPVPAGVVGVEASGTEGETPLDVVELSVSVLVAADVGISAGVEVEETNGGACWM